MLLCETVPNLELTDACFYINTSLLFFFAICFDPLLHHGRLLGVGLEWVGPGDGHAGGKRRGGGVGRHQLQCAGFSKIYGVRKLINNKHRFFFFFCNVNSLFYQPK